MFASQGLPPHLALQKLSVRLHYRDGRLELMSGIRDETTLCLVCLLHGSHDAPGKPTGHEEEQHEHDESHDERVAKERSHALGHEGVVHERDQCVTHGTFHGEHERTFQPAARVLAQGVMREVDELADRVTIRVDALHGHY